jgi:hypothetical protein
MKHFAGLDVSLQETATCVVDKDGIIVIEGKAASEPADLIRWLAATGLTIAVSGSTLVRCRCMEESERPACRRSASRPGG